MLRRKPSEIKRLFGRIMIFRTRFKKHYKNTHNSLTGQGALYMIPPNSEYSGLEPRYCWF